MAGAPRDLDQSDSAAMPPPARPNSSSSHPDKASQLSSLIASANAQYAQKRYEAAAETYSEAVALQDEINGEMSVTNADLFYAYGRCLFQLAMSKSDVLGGKVAGEEPADKPRKKAKVEADGHAPGSSAAASNGTASEVGILGEEVMERAVEEKEGMRDDLKEEPSLENKPYFQFKGDENLEESDEEAEDVDGEVPDGEGAVEEAAEQDDFAYAFEILDIARVLLLKKLDSLRTDEKGKSTEIPPEERSTKERLADIHDLQGEISLENERFSDAVNDFRSAMSIKQEFEPKESKYLAELHYKLALALEFASLTTNKDSNGDNAANGTGNEAQVDDAMREDAAKEMELAIESCRLRTRMGEEKIGGLDPKAAEALRKEIAEVKSICEEMEQRLTDLRTPFQPSHPTNDPADPTALRGILGSILGESPAEQKARIEEATRNANDLTGLVKHRKKADSTEERAGGNTGVVEGEGEGGVVNGNGMGGGKAMGKGKRKADDAGGEDGVDGGGVKVVVGKRAWVEESYEGSS